MIMSRPEQTTVKRTNSHPLMYKEIPHKSSKKPKKSGALFTAIRTTDAVLPGDMKARPTFLSLNQTARHLGFDAKTIKKIAARCSAFSPALHALPITHKTPRTRKYFHETQIQIMAAALAGAIDIKEADMKWRVLKARMREEVMAL